MRQPRLDYREASIAGSPGRVRLLFRLFLALLVIGPVAGVTGQRTYDPEHPDVQKMINAGLAYIVENAQSGQVGNRIMMGMAAYKAQVVTSPNPKEHPLIDLAIETIREQCTANRLSGGASFEKMYASALACVFLLELDSDKYRSEIEVLLDHIAERQQASGAWGYRTESPQRGDVSQMQYIALALWLANEKGFRVNFKATRDALDWMLEHQESNGGWFYKYPPDPLAVNRDLSRAVRPPLVAAGLGTVYLYADLLRLTSRSGSLGPKLAEDPDLPPDVVDVTNEKNPESVTEEAGPRVQYDRGKLVRGMNNGNRWFQANFSPQCEHYNMYFLYGYERYAALREYVDGENRGVEDWYDQGVEFLKNVQSADGAMVRGSTGEVAATVQTAFAVLFLTRSMSITIADKASSVLPGGLGFPSDVILKERGETIVGGMVERSVTDMLQLLQNPDQDEWELYLNSLDELKLDGDNVSRNEQLSTLRGLVTHENYQARVIAVKFLSKQRSLENVPAFIYALTDPDERVVEAANEALRFVSRKTDAPGWMPRMRPPEPNSMSSNGIGRSGF